MKIRLLHDWIRVRIEPARTQTSGGIILAGPEPIRIAEVLEVGPGRRHRKTDVLLPMNLKVGDRFPFFKAADETKQGRALAVYLEEDEALLRESDALFAIDEGNPEITL